MQVIYEAFAEYHNHDKVSFEIYTAESDHTDFIFSEASESNWIVPDFVRPIHYSIFEDE